MTDLTAQLNAAMPFGGFLGLEVLAASADEVRARSTGPTSSAPPAGSSTAAR
jgi:hypothetical protein